MDYRLSDLDEILGQMENDKSRLPLTWGELLSMYPTFNEETSRFVITVNKTKLIFINNKESYEKFIRDLNQAGIVDNKFEVRFIE